MRNISPHTSFNDYQLERFIKGTDVFLLIRVCGHRVKTLMDTWNELTFDNLPMSSQASDTVNAKTNKSSQPSGGLIDVRSKRTDSL